MVTVNGRTFSGNNVQISNGKISIDGKPVELGADEKQISIVVHGDGANVDVDSCESVTVHGDAKGINSTNGNVAVTGIVSGNVETVNGNVSCGAVGNTVRTVNGNIRHN